MKILKVELNEHQKLLIYCTGSPINRCYQNENWRRFKMDWTWFLRPWITNLRILFWKSIKKHIFCVSCNFTAHLIDNFSKIAQNHKFLSAHFIYYETFNLREVFLINNRWNGSLDSITTKSMFLDEFSKLFFVCLFKASEIMSTHHFKRF